MHPISILKMKRNKLGYVTEVRDENDIVLNEFSWMNSQYRRDKKWKTYKHVASGQPLHIVEEDS
jgi:hypothetical protein